jgi:hypothetical protein
MRMFILTTHNLRHLGDSSPIIRISSVLSSIDGSIQHLADVVKAHSQPYDPTLLRKSTKDSERFTYQMSDMLRLVITENKDVDYGWC